MADHAEENDAVGGVIHITNQCIAFHGTVVPIRNISRLRSYEIRRKEAEAATYGGLTVLCLIGAAVAGVSGISESAAAVGLLLIGAAVFALLALKSALFRRYGLSIETNGGTRDFILAKDKSFANKVLLLLRHTLQDQERPVSYTVNMDNRKIEGDKFENIAGDVQIATRGSRIQ
jgi:hypothetical protein